MTKDVGMEVGQSPGAIVWEPELRPSSAPQCVSSRLIAASRSEQRFNQPKNSICNESPSWATNLFGSLMALARSRPRDYYYVSAAP
jgi:hypothetical protein